MSLNCAGAEGVAASEESSSTLVIVVQTTPQKIFSFNQEKINAIPN